MSVFADYARYYDLLYASKDYAAEAAYVDRLLRDAEPSARTLLELGCGTAVHASQLAAKGYEVWGVERSERMLGLAESRLAENAEIAGSVRLIRGDIRTVRAERTFDAVVSLFHVISYLTGNADLRNAFETARMHLRSGGVLLFDCWYGPAVLTQKPERRVLQRESDELALTRVAEPVMHPNENVVDVNYQIDVREKATGRTERLRETHRMRYLFLPEIDDLLERFHFERMRAEEWITGNAPGIDTWSVCVVARAV